MFLAGIMLDCLACLLVGERIVLSSSDVLLLTGVILPKFCVKFGVSNLLLIMLSSCLSKTLALFCPSFFKPSEPFALVLSTLNPSELP